MCYLCKEMIIHEDFRSLQKSIKEFLIALNEMVDIHPAYIFMITDGLNKKRDTPEHMKTTHLCYGMEQEEEEHVCTCTPLMSLLRFSYHKESKFQKKAISLFYKLFPS